MAGRPHTPEVHAGRPPEELAHAEGAKVAPMEQRALGHVIGGVRGVYDRHGYRDEKRKAFEAHAGYIAGVVSPQPNVVPLRRAADTIAGKGNEVHPED